MPGFILILLRRNLINSGKHLTFRDDGTDHCERDQSHELQRNTHFKNHCLVEGYKRVSSLAATRRMIEGKMKLANLPIKQSIMGRFRGKLLKVKKRGRQNCTESPWIAHNALMKSLSEEAGDRRVNIYASLRDTRV